MHGMILTQTDDLTRFLSDLRSARVPLLKVVTGWGWHWDAQSIAQVSQLPALIVRTVTGDGCRPSPRPDGFIFPEPQTVVDELSPWLVHRPNMMVEIGNEPNNPAHGDPSTDAAYRFWYYFRESVKRVRSAFPTARIISPGLTPDNQAGWWQAAMDANDPTLPFIDLVGFHSYAYHNFIPDDKGELTTALSQLRQYFPTRAWMLTEAGINDPPTPDATKCDRYCKMHLNLPSQVAGVCWYHACQHPGDPDASAYALDVSSWSHLKAGGTL